MLVYLDNCMFNRPFDKQDHIRVRLETEAKLHIQHLIKQGKLSLVWSYILDFENSQNPFYERRFAIEKWEFIAKYHILENQQILNYANSLSNIGIKTKDALHLACAVEAGAEYFLSTDDKLLKKIQLVSTIQGLNPTEFIQGLNDDY